MMSWWLLCCTLPLIAPLLWFLCTRHSFVYYAKFCSLALWFTLAALVHIPIFAFRPFRLHNIWLTLRWLRFTLKFFCISPTFEVRNRCQLEEYDRPRVIVCNHQSALDVIGMVQLFPRRTTVLMKRSLMYYGPFGLASLLAGVIFVDRSSNPQNTHHSHIVAKTAQIMMSRNASVWIFPEGTRNDKAQFLPFKTGAFYLAIHAQVPIFPVVFSSYQDFLSTEQKILNHGKIIITCLSPVQTAGLTADDAPSLIDNVRSAMESVFRETSDEVHAEAERNGTSIL